MPRKPRLHIHDFCEDKARSGEGAYALAYALLELAEAQMETAKALDHIGRNDLNPTGPPGALEELAIQMKRVADALENQS